MGDVKTSRRPHLTFASGKLWIVVAEALSVGTPVFITNKVSLLREVDSYGAGIVAKDNQAGIDQLIRSWNDNQHSEWRVPPCVALRKTSYQEYCFKYYWAFERFECLNKLSLCGLTYCKGLFFPFLRSEVERLKKPGISWEESLWNLVTRSPMYPGFVMTFRRRRHVSESAIFGFLSECSEKPMAIESSWIAICFACSKSPAKGRHLSNTCLWAPIILPSKRLEKNVCTCGQVPQGTNEIISQGHALAGTKLSVRDALEGSAEELR